MGGAEFMQKAITEEEKSEMIKLLSAKLLEVSGHEDQGNAFSVS